MSLVDKLERCRAATNKSFDPRQSSTTLQDFRRPWNRVWKKLLLFLSEEEQGPSEALSLLETWIKRLWTLHTEPTRHYHTAVHLVEMFEYFAAVQEAHEDWKHLETSQEVTIVLSIYFHDAIYNPQSATNEEDSEKLWQEFTKEVNSMISDEIVKDVSRFILATKAHKISNNDKDDPALALFLDLDLAVLAKEKNAYMSYAALIRQEYHFVAAETYCSKRAEILQDMANQKRLFASPVFAAWETRARDNLHKEVSLLNQGTIPA